MFSNVPAKIELHRKGKGGTDQFLKFFVALSADVINLKKPSVKRKGQANF